MSFPSSWNNGLISSHGGGGVGGGGGRRGRGHGRRGGRAGRAGRGRGSSGRRNYHDGGGRRQRRGMNPSSSCEDSERFNTTTSIEEIGVVKGGSDADDDDWSKGVVRIAVEGCCHGQLDTIYQRLQEYEQQQQQNQNGDSNGKKIDLLLCCGDFQSHRNVSDIHSSSIPPKYRNDLGSFSKYYSGEKKAPILTIFIGGNHEASQPLNELYYGGWVCPNIYYLGAAGVVRFQGLRIGGLSGIYKSHDYHQPHWERMPYNARALRSVYHVRKVDVDRLKCLTLFEGGDSNNENDQNRLDIMLTHDWPQDIVHHGNVKQLLKTKPFFRQDIASGALGSPASRELLYQLRPKYWFAAHLHVKFHATVVFPKNIMENNQTIHEGTDDTKGNPQLDFVSLIPSQVTNRTAKEADQFVIDYDGDAVKVAPTNPNNNQGGDDHYHQHSENVKNSAASTTIDKCQVEGGDNNIDDETSPTPTSFTQFHALHSNVSSCDPMQEDLTAQMTRFLALDKCLPRRHFLSILTVPIHKKKNNNHQHPHHHCQKYLEYDPEWLAILRKTHHWNTTTATMVADTQPNELFTKTELLKEKEWVLNRLRERQQAAANQQQQSTAELATTTTLNDANNNNENPETMEIDNCNNYDEEATATLDDSYCLRIPENFVATVPLDTDPLFKHGNTDQVGQAPPPFPPMGNPITDQFLDLLLLDHVVTQPYDPNLTPERLSTTMRTSMTRRMRIRGDQPRVQNVPQNANVSTTTASVEPGSDCNEIDIDYQTGQEEAVNDDDDDNEILLDELDDDEKEKQDDDVAFDQNEEFSVETTNKKQRVDEATTS